LTITPISRHGQLFDQFRAVAAALITDPDSTPVPLSAHLRSIFGFTSTEAEVARLLMRGLDRQEIADQLLISLNTVRAHLRNLFGKTGASSQAKLVRALFVATRMVPEPPAGSQPSLSCPG
jgi:DNA-binding CsgD family transcriptional regulator